jgi:hypothetical protein
MKTNAVLNCVIALSVMLLCGASQINASSVNRAKSGPGPAPWLRVASVQAPTAKSGPGPAPWLRVASVQAPTAKSGPGPAPWLALGSNF